MTETSQERMDQINRSSNEIKIGSALSLTVDSIYDRYSKMGEITDELRSKRASELAKVWASGFESLRSQTIYETASFLTDKGESLSKPGFGAEVLGLLALIISIGGVTADRDVKEFMKIAIEASGGHVECEFVTDENDPRITPVDKNFPNCEGSA